jgi:AcrR family transcriptional regulator
MTQSSVNQTIDRDDDEPAPVKGAAARTRALMVATASRMMRRGLSPSVSEVAEAAGVSRSTAYRYFPTQADMLRAVVAEALGPILNWTGAGASGAARLVSLYEVALPRLFEHEATFRAALRQSLEAGATAPADGTLGRGHRRDLLARAIKGLGLPPDRSRRLVRALSLTFGIESIIVMKDIWGMGDSEAQETVLWAVRALLDAALRESQEAQVNR